MRSRRAQSVTIRDVAREAEVSIATASRALNGMDNVTEETRERILKAARRLRYVPHSGARLLSTRRTRTLGLILPDPHGEDFPEIIRGAGAAARARGLQLLLSSSHHDHEAVAGVIRSMRGRVDGLMIMSPDVDSRVLTDDLPVVLLNVRSLTTVSAKIADLSRRALEQLIQLIDGPDAGQALQPRSDPGALR